MHKLPASYGVEAQGLPQSFYKFRLFVAGSSSRSQSAIRSIRHICETYLKDAYFLEVIDLYQHPEFAKDLQIIALPTLIKAAPLPVKRIIGDLSDHRQVCQSLDISLSDSSNL